MRTYTSACGNFSDALTTATTPQNRNGCHPFTPFSFKLVRFIGADTY